MPFSTVKRSIGLLLWLCGGLWPALGRATPEAATPSAPAAVAYTSRAGDSLEKIASRQYPGTPLQPQVLARLLLEHNAPVLGPGSTPKKRLKPGTALSLPSHEQLMRQIFAPYLSADAAAQAASQGPQARRSWVHYP